MSTPKEHRTSAAVFAVIAIVTGVLAFLYAGLVGRRAGWELMIILAAPAALFGLLGIAIERRALTVVGLLGGLLGAVGFYLGR